MPALTAIDSHLIAAAYLSAIYRDNNRNDFFGMAKPRFIDTLQEAGVSWAPDGDEAFDDGSHVLQFDIGNKVRLIAFVNTDLPEDLESTICEEWLDAEYFYAVLESWSEMFEAERASKLA